MQYLVARILPSLKSQITFTSIICSRLTSIPNVHVRSFSPILLSLLMNDFVISLRFFLVCRVRYYTEPMRTG